MLRWLGIQQPSVPRSSAVLHGQAWSSGQTPGDCDRLTQAVGAQGQATSCSRFSLEGGHISSEKFVGCSGGPDPETLAARPHQKGPETCVSSERLSPTLSQELTSPRLVKSHLPYRFLPSDLHNGDSKVIPCSPSQAGLPPSSSQRTWVEQDPVWAADPATACISSISVTLVVWGFLVAELGLGQPQFSRCVAGREFTADSPTFPAA